MKITDSKANAASEVTSERVGMVACTDSAGKFVILNPTT